MSTFIISPLALVDLGDIAFYTEARWGRRQRDNYIHDLNDCFGTLAESPGLGRSRDEIRQGLRSLAYKQHVIFYRLEASDIEIVRILHTARDVNRHL